ncbi:hypothetical protein DPMN_067303 [Dreissena polymorpha]|uniref:Uncharacterized protein n=1 Tax=Dreissena polymorpha TaxID=45954 RepID=A0A9D4BTE4_DREPO|nr:hypothetical protein DPMN_067303 [Dreissena polymorpha]
MARQRRGAPGLIMGPCIIEIDRIVIRYVQYKFEVSRCRNEEFMVKGNFGWAWSMWARAPQVNRCRNEEVIMKGNFEWAWSMWAGGAPGLVMGPYIVEIDRIVIRDVQNEEVIVKGNFGWAWSMRAGRPRVGNGAMHINGCRNEEVNFQGSSAYSVGGDSGQGGRTDRRTDRQTDRRRR